MTLAPGLVIQSLDCGQKLVLLSGEARGHSLRIKQSLEAQGPPRALGGRANPLLLLLGQPPLHQRFGSKLVPLRGACGDSLRRGWRGAALLSPPSGRLTLQILPDALALRRLPLLRLPGLSSCAMQLAGQPTALTAIKRKAEDGPPSPART